MSQVPVLPPNSELTVQPESTTQKLPGFEEYNAILEKYPSPSACESLFCIGYQSEGKTQFGADINAGVLVEKPFKNREAWYASINHASNSTELSPFVSGTADMGLAMKWIIQKRSEKDTQLCVIDSTKLKPGSMIEMNRVLDALGGSSSGEHNTNVLIWQSIPATAVENRMFLNDIPVLTGFLPETEPGKVTREEEYQDDCELYLQSKTELSFKDWWIAGHPKGPESAASEPGIRQIVESFRLTKDS